MSLLHATFMNIVCFKMALLLRDMDGWLQSSLRMCFFCGLKSMSEYGRKLYPRFCRRHQPIQTVTQGRYWGGVWLTQIWDGIVLRASYSSLPTIAGWLTGTYDMNDIITTVQDCCSASCMSHSWYLFIKVPVMQRRYLTDKRQDQNWRISTLPKSHKTSEHTNPSPRLVWLHWSQAPGMRDTTKSKSQQWQLLTTPSPFFPPSHWEIICSTFRAFTGLCNHAEPTTEQVVRQNPPWQIKIA